MPILGVIASSKLVQSGAWESILTYTVTSPTSINITGIPSGYKDLRIHIRGRDNRSDGGTISTAGMNFNGSTIRIQSQQLYGTGGSVGTVQTYSDQGEGYGQLERFSGGGAPANLVGGIVLDIKDYTNTSKYKTWYYRSTNAGSSTNQTTLHTFTWPSTAAINQVSFLVGFNVTAFVAPTTISMYGIRG
jgi:hypothetical protein